MMVLMTGGRFFKQEPEEKMKVSGEMSKYFNGYKGPGTTLVQKAEGVDVKESVRNAPRLRVSSMDLINCSFPGDTSQSMILTPKTQPLSRKK